MRMKRNKRREYNRRTIRLRRIWRTVGIALCACCVVGGGVLAVMKSGWLSGDKETGIPVPTAQITAQTDAVSTEVPDTAHIPTQSPRPQAQVVLANPLAEPTSTPFSTGAADVTEPDKSPGKTAMMAETQKPTPSALPLAGVKIGIDPGHQAKANSEQEPVAPGSKETKKKVSSGTAGVSTRVAEYIVNLDVALQLRDALQSLGAEVYMTRETNDVNISNIERAQMMNDLSVDLVLRIHCNGSTDRSVNGIGLYIRKTGEKAEECEKAAEVLLPAMADATSAKANGIYKRDTYSGLNWSTVPSILVEMGYMSNKQEDERLNDPEYQKKLVWGMVQGIADYMSRTLPTDDLTGDSGSAEATHQPALDAADELAE